MFDNIGDKIKSSARTSFILWAIVAVISGIVLMFEESFVVGLLVALVGPGFLLGFFQLVYGFGQLVENSDIIAEEHKRVNEKHEKAVAKNNEKKQAQRKKQIKANIENPNFDEDEYIDVEAWDLEDLMQMIYESKIQDAKTICGILTYASKYGRED